MADAPVQVKSFQVLEDRDADLDVFLDLAVLLGA